MNNVLGTAITDHKTEKNKQHLIETPRKYYLVHCNISYFCLLQSILGWLLLLILGALVILNIFLTNMASFLLIATTLSFLTAPFFAIANYILVVRYLPKSKQPSTSIKALSWLGIIYLFVFCGIYIWSLL